MLSGECMCVEQREMLSDECCVLSGECTYVCQAKRNGDWWVYVC